MKQRHLMSLQNKSDGEKAQSAQSQYCEEISARLGIMQVILYFALFAFIILSFISNTNLITYRNFYYFFKDLDASSESVNVFKSDSVTYPTSNSQYFTLYRGGLSVIGDRSVSTFTSTGRQTLSWNIQYRNPLAEGKGRYLMVYEMGGTQYSLYNSYTQLYADSTEYPITGVAVSDSGMYAILSSSEKYTSVVTLYNDNFALINRYNKTSFVTDVAINEKGKLVAMLSATPKGGAFESTLELYVPGAEQAKSTVSLGEGMAYSCSFTSSGVLVVSSSTAIVFVSPDGTILSRFDFQGELPVLADVGADGAAIVLQSSPVSEKNHVIAFDKNGKALYNEIVDAEIAAVARYGNALFFMTDTEIQQVLLNSGSTATVVRQTENRHILAVSENELLICSPQKAEYIRFQS